MRKLMTLGFCIMISVSLAAQFKTFTIQKSDVAELNIVQIDFGERSTIVHFRFINDSSVYICAGENFYIKDNETNIKYKLINSINLPICDKVHILDVKGQIHNFSLEFEKLPDTTRNIDIIESPEGGFNLYGVDINKQIREKNFIDIDKFISETPVKEYGLYYKDGEAVLFYKHKGIMIAVTVSFDKNYGKYYQANILVQNFTGKDILLDPSAIKAVSVKKGKITEIEVLSYSDYMRKVKSRQAWNAFAVAFSQSTSASNAGYSSSTTTGSAYGISNSYGSASGNVGNTYGSVHATSSTYSSAYGRSTTNSYNGAAAYSAQQNAKNNISNYQNQQFEVKKTLSEGYLKMNTISNKSEYVGFVNIVYRTVEGLRIDVPLNGATYSFTWRD